MEICLRYKGKEMKKNLIRAFILLVCWAGTAFPQNVTTAGLELANTFQQINTFLSGIKLQGANAGSVLLLPAPTGSTYSLTFPGAAPLPNQILAGDVVTGTLKWTSSCGGFQAGGDLAGNSTSQSVVGINGIAVDTTVTPQDGWALKYNAANNKWTPAP